MYYIIYQILWLTGLLRTEVTKLRMTIGYILYTSPDVALDPKLVIRNVCYLTNMQRMCARVASHVHM